ncbi:unnamed protein product, partial [Rotaria sp. Silwood2]
MPLVIRIMLESTVIQLIHRFYDPDSGCVLLDGQDIKTLDVAWLRSHIGIVSQESALFTGSIEENIRFGKPDATDDEVIAAAKMANAHDFIMELPDRMVQDALDRAKEGRTTIVIAHRLSTIRNVDTIIVIDKGEVIECGTHNELMKKNGQYNEFVTAQQQAETNDEKDESDDEEHLTSNNKSHYDLQHATSMISIKSKISNKSINIDAEGVVVNNSRYCRWPFIFKILRLNLPELHWIIIGSIASLIFGGITPLFALFISNVYELFAEQDLNKANIQTRNLALFIFCIGIVGALCQFLSSVAFAKSGEALTMRMRMMSFGSMLRQEMSWFDCEENSVGALVTQLSSDTSNFKGLSGLRIGVIFNALGAIICTLTIVFISGWKLSLVLLLFTPLIVFSGIVQGQRLSNTKRNSTGSTKETSWIEKGGMFISTAMIPDYTKGKISAMRILTLNNRRSQIDPSNTNGTILNNIVGYIEFQQVKFAYPSRPELRILKSLNLCASANQTTALVGRSGSGKSTCAALVLRLYDPYRGAVLLDGHDVRSLNISWLRSQFGLVQQEPVLFNLSIRDNIAYGVNTRTVTQEEIEEAARKANVHDMIISLPQGYDTLCGFKGNQMSGGQKQRIAIARALIRQPKLLLFDEATSALDVCSEKLVQDALNRTRNGRTCLTITHRLSTIRDSEQIVVIDRGRVKESGTHNDLMCHKGAYYKLNMIQERNDG